MSDENPKEYRFGNEKFGGFYRPGEFELNLPDDLTLDELEEMFAERIGALHKFGREIYPFDDDEPEKTRKEKLKPLSIRVKEHTKEFFKNKSILSAREVLEIYENYNNASEAFIDSLLKEEKDLEKQLAEIQEKLHNAKLFKDKLNDLDLEKAPLDDEDRIAILNESFKDSEIKTEASSDKIIADIELYNTKKVAMHVDDYLEITALNDLTPVIYYFENDFDPDELTDLAKSVKDYCDEKEIECCLVEDSIFSKDEE